MAKYGARDWFEELFAATGGDPWGLSWRFSQQVRYSRTLSIVRGLEQPPGLVLDIGCATGEFTSMLTSFLPASRVIGIDFATAAVERARNRFPNIEFQCSSLQEVQDRWNDVGLITCLEVMYYLDAGERLASLQSIKHALRPGGFAVFSSLVSSAPYFTPDSLQELVRSEFEIAEVQCVHAKPLSLLEKFPLKARLVTSRIFPQSVSDTFGRCLNTLGRPLSRPMNRLERRLAALGDRTLSHVIVLAGRTS